MELENQLMWQEVGHLREKAPHNDFNNMEFQDRKALFVEGTIFELGQGKHPMPEDLSTTIKYKGPQIKPLLPNYVAEHLSYKETLNIDKLTNMEVLKKHHDL